MIKRLLMVWKVIHVSWKKVSSDEDCPLYSSDSFTARHIWSVEEHGLHVASLQSLPRNHSYRAKQQESMDKAILIGCVGVQAGFLLWLGQRAVRESII